MNFLYLLVLALLLVVQTSVTASVTCGPGFIQDKDSCEDDNECEEKEERCGNNSVCYNTLGSFYCQCEQGYKAKLFNFTAVEGGPCKDINECEANKSICGPNAVCFNIAGSYYCSCATGFVASNGQEHFNASQDVTCEVIQTSVTASVNCGIGYVQNKDGCEDYDECEEEKEERCGNNSVCYNTLGSYYCQCEPGYKVKLFNFTIDKGGPCQDINECVENKTICGPNAVCSNILGSYYCSCAPGFEASNRQEHLNTSQDVTCEDEDECEEGLCGNNAVCYNTLGSYYCRCESGYKAKSLNFNGEQGGPCRDINECEEKSICGPNAVCSNNIGSYYCSCATGFVASNGQEHFNARQSVTCDSEV